MSAALTKPITLFYIYARKDEDLLDELEKQLAPLKRLGYLVGWYDRQIEAGKEWQKEIEAHLSEANIILMLLSSDFTRSDACEDEMRRALDLYEKGHTRVIPILLRPCLWQMTAVAELQILPANGQPIDIWPKRDEAFHHVAYHLANIVRKQCGLPLLQAQSWPSMLSPLPPPPPDPSQPLVDTPSFKSRNPYRGLEAFRQEDAGDFFGRDNLVAKLLLAFQKIAFPAQPNGNARLLSVVGPSGSGKSSVVEAGLLPALKRGDLPGSGRWIYLDQMRPGPNPLEALAITLAPHFPQKPMSLLLQELSDPSTSGLHFLLQTLTRGQATVAFLHIDQFEEVFTQTLERERRDFFLSLLVTALTASRSSLAIVTSLRADFYDRPMQLFPDLFRLMKKAQVEVLPLDRHDLLDVIKLPATLPDVRLQFEDKLISELVAEMHQQTGALPLLQFMLYQLFQTRAGKRILTLDAYNGIGGVQGALHNHAEDILASVGPENLDLTRSLFLCLVEPGADQNPIRRRLTFNELAIDEPLKKALQEIIARFTDARLLTMTEQNENVMVEVSHEAIIRGWKRLAHWLRAASEDLYQQRRLREDALNWHRHYLVGMLYHDDQLWRTTAWIQSYRPLLSRMEVTFLDVSTRNQRAIEAQRRRAQEEMEEGMRRVLRQREREMEEQRRKLNQANAMARPFVRRTVLIGLGGISLVAATGAATGIIEWFAHQPITSPSPSVPINLPFVGQAHTGSVKSVAWSPDSARLASGSADKTIRIWDARSGQSSACTGHTGSVNGVAWSPDGAHLASASADQTVRTWDASSWLSQLNLSGHTGAVNSVAWSPTGMRVASASDDRTVRLWDTSSSNPQEVQQNLRGYTGHSGAVTSVEWSPDGGRLASASADQTVHIWDASTTRTLLIYRGHSDTVTCAAWSPNGKYIASASTDQMVRIWDTSNGQILLTYRGHTDAVNSVAWSPDGKWLVSATSNNEKAIHVWNASGGWTVLAYTAHTNAVNSVAWSANGKYIASASDDATMRIWDASIASKRTVATYTTHTDAVKSVAWSPDGTRLASSSDDKSVLVWDTGDGKAPLTYNTRNDIVDCVAWSPDGTRLAFASADKTVQVWDSHNGQSLLICTGHTGAVNGIAWSPDSQFLASASADATARLWDARSGKPLFTYTGHNGSVNSIAWSPDGLYLASTSDDSTAQIWDASTGKSAVTCTGHSGSVNSVAWSPNSQQIVTAGDDASARTWDARSGLTVLTYTGQSSSIHSAAWSPDGKFIASASYDTTVAVWNASTGRTQLVYKGHHRSVNSVAWSPDRKHLASASDDTTVQVWLWLQT